MFQNDPQTDSLKLNAGEACTLCALRTSSDVVTEWQNWRLVVNHNQNYLGKVMLVLNRHATDVTELTAKEQSEFWSVLAKTKHALELVFAPDHFNYAFLMNQDAHVHMHIIPRYAHPREFAGQIFHDEQLAEHYRLTSNLVPTDIRAAIAHALRDKGMPH